MLATVILWHLLQPVLYFYVFIDDYHALGLLQRVLGAGVALREALYALSVLTCVWVNPAFLLIDINAAVKDEDKRGQATIRGYPALLTYVVLRFGMTPQTKVNLYRSRSGH